MPTRIVYPGERIGVADLRRVVVRNTRPVASPVARAFDQAVGRVATRTLLPRRYIALSALRAPDLVTSGKAVQLTYRTNGLLITTRATALETGAAGETVSVRTGPANRIVTAQVMPDGTVEVAR